MPDEPLLGKLHRLFDHLDIDGNGEIDEFDYVLLGPRVAEMFGYPVGSRFEERITERYLNIWRTALEPMVPPGATGLSRARFVDALCGLVQNDPAVVESVAREVAEVFLEAADLDADRQVTPEEFAIYLRHGFPHTTDAEADAAFTRLDLDGDGVLSAEEFVRATVGYWTGTDPESSSDWLLGPPH